MSCYTIQYALEVARGDFETARSTLSEAGGREMVTVRHLSRLSIEETKT